MQSVHRSPCLAQARHNALLVAALRYASRGWAVFPLHEIRGGRCTCGSRRCTNVGKHPRTRHGFKDATTVAAVLHGWWRTWSDANVGIVTGAASGLVVLDIDPRHDGDDTLRELEKRHGVLPDTPRVLTGGGGVHIYLRHPGGTVSCSAGSVGPGLDVRGDGGYVVAPPSTHASGYRYTWMIGFADDDVSPAPAPAWLLERLRRTRTDGLARSADEWTALVQNGADAGYRNDALARLTGYLLRRRPSPRVVLALMLAWNESRCRPPLADREVTATVDSIARREAARRRGQE